MKEQFRDFCGLYTEFYLRNLILPEITQGQKLEAVLIEFRPFNCIEFIIRNAIFKLGKDWSFTVICGNLNYDMFKTICDMISKNIKVIRLDDIDNVNQNEYNNLMLTDRIWNLLTGEKILIYQEDSYIFQSNIHEFLEWDYIGAPWPLNQNQNKNHVGNGGLSLRTLSVIKDIIKTISYLETNSSTLNYMRGAGLDRCPEDVFFSKAIIDSGLGRVADYETAKRFSIESINCADSFGGHQFWMCEPDWLNRIHSTSVIQFQPNLGNYQYEHRGGWPDVIDYMKQHQFYNPSSSLKFFDVLEHNFLWNTNYQCNEKWCGIIHCTQKTPGYLNCVNIEFMFNNTNFIKSLDNCFLLITTSEYTRKYIDSRLREFGKNTQTICIHHPIKDHNAPCFTLERFQSNPDKKLIQIGQQLRIMSSIYKLDNIGFKRIWLTGTRNYSHVNRLLNFENQQIDRSSVNMYYTKNIEEYDNLLTENVVFLHLFDAAANNTILECIIRNTPIIVNRIDAVVEYLGENYPLYFNELSEVPMLLERVEQAHIYLTKIDKTRISMEYFYKRLLTSINYSFRGININCIPEYPPLVNIPKQLQPFDWWNLTENQIKRYTNLPSLPSLPSLQNLSIRDLPILPGIKIIDTFIFYNEIDMLTYRLNVLNDLVDYFVIVEATHTFVGNPKKLYYKENKHLFEKFESRIIHIVVDDLPCIPPNTEEKEQWINEKYQRNCIDRGIKQLELDPYDIIIIADVDEIPDPETLQKIKNETINVTVNPLEMDFYYYNLESQMVDKWLHCKVLIYEKYLSFDSCETIRSTCWENSIKKGGWHLSYFATTDVIQNKIENFSHQEYNNANFNTIENIESSRNNYTSIFGSDHAIIKKIDLNDNKYLPPEPDKFYFLIKTRSVFVINNNLNHTIVNLQGCGASETTFYNTVASLSKQTALTVYNQFNQPFGIIDRLTYRDYNTFNESGKVVVLQRFFNEVINFHKKWPTNRYILWSHDYLEKSSTLFGEYSRDYINEYYKTNGITVVAVSNFHKSNILSFLPDVEIKVIYNALFPEYVPKQLTVKQNEITFASNWYKGLERVLNIVKELNKTHAIKLNLLKPSYCNWDRDFSKDYPFVNVIGNVKDKKEYSQIISRSICVLTTSYPETFGCVFSESLHLGTPVIADKSVDAGFHEFIEDCYKVDFNNIDQVVEKILEIKNTNPDVSLPNEFYEDAITSQWKCHLKNGNVI